MCGRLEHVTFLLHQELPYNMYVYTYMLKTLTMQTTRETDSIVLLNHETSLLVGTTFVLFFYNMLAEINMLNSKI